MISLRRSFPAIALFFLTSACTPPAESNSTNSSGTIKTAAVSNRANAKPEELGLLINFTLEPEDIVWHQSETNKKIVAVFRLDEADTKKLADQLSSRSPGAPRSVAVEEWFPTELVAGGESSGNSSVDGTAFPADDFYQAPYTQGTITRVENTDFFVLEISAV